MGSFGGSLRDMPVYEIGKHAIREAVRRADVPADEIDEVLYGNTRQAGNGPNPGRTAALFAGVPSSVHATTVNDACPSSMKATIIAAQMLCLEEAQIMLVGGMESMSTIPLALLSTQNHALLRPVPSRLKRPRYVGPTGSRWWPDRARSASRCRAPRPPP